MTPYVIDKSKRREYFLFFAFFTIISFSLGYFFGYQKAQSDSLINTIPPVAEKSAVEESAALENMPGAVKKVTSQGIKSTTKENKDSREGALHKNKTEKKTTKAINKTTHDKPRPMAEANTASKSQLKAKITTAKSIGAKSAPRPIKPSLVAVKPVAQVNALSAKFYSVQVGMFASKPNAEKFVNTLKNRGFDVYLGDFISSGGQEKYNVRLGPYTMRALARDNMALYKKSYTSPAYIVINK
jgi:cell division protein FtsN